VMTTDRPLDVSALREQLRRIDEALRDVEYYRADPPSKPRHDLVRAALQPLMSA